MPTFDSKISLGNVIQFVVLIVALIAAWSKLVTRDELINGYVRIDVNQLQMQMIDSKILATNNKLDEIRTDVKDIKRAVR